MTKFNSKDNKTDKCNNSSQKLNTLEKIDKESKVSKSHNIKDKKGNKFLSKCKKNINNFCKTTCKKINNLNCSHIFFDACNSSNNSDNDNCINIVSNNNNKLNDNKLNNNKLNDNIYHNLNKDNHNNNCFYKKKKRKQKIPLAVKQNVWVTNFGEVYKHKCYVDWCHRVMTVFEFEVGHNIPESKGGTLDLDNLRPICHQCNIGMGNQYTIDEWSDQKFLDK